MTFMVQIFGSVTAFVKFCVLEIFTKWNQFKNQ